MRKLEFLLADAVSKGCKHIISSGSIQSNHARSLAVACAQLGLQCHIFLAMSSDNPVSFGLFAAHSNIIPWTDLYNKTCSHMSCLLRYTGQTTLWKYVDCYMEWSKKWSRHSLSIYLKTSNTYFNSYTLDNFNMFSIRSWIFKPIKPNCRNGYCSIIQCRVCRRRTICPVRSIILC